MEKLFTIIQIIYQDDDGAKNKGDFSLADRFHLSIIKKKLKSQTAKDYGLNLITEWQAYIEPMGIYLPGNQGDKHMILLWASKCQMTELINEVIVERLIDECVVEFEDLKDLKGNEMTFKPEFINLLHELKNKYESLTDDLRRKSHVTETDEFAINELVKALTIEPESKRMKL
jgi:hypothetical protein